MRTRIGFLSVVLLVGLSAACGPGYQVVRSGGGTPPTAASRFFVEPIQLGQLQVGDETRDHYHARKSAPQRKSLVDDENAMAQEFYQRLASDAPAGRVYTTPGPGMYTVRPVLVYWEPGFYLGRLGRRDAEAHLQLYLIDPSGQLVDQLAIRVAEVANIIHPSSGDRMRSCGNQLGNRVAQYLTDRTSDQYARR